MKILAAFIAAALCAGVVFAAQGLAEQPDAGKPGKAEPGDPAGDAKKEADEEAAALRTARERLEKLDPDTRRVLDLMDVTHKKIESFSASYRQVRKVRIRRAPVVSSGSIHVKKQPGGKGMKVLFAEEKPSKSKVVFTDTEVVFLDGETGEIKRSDPRQGSVRPSEVWVLGRPVLDIVRFYEPKFLKPEEEEDKKYMGRLELVPVSEKIRKWVKRIVVWLRKDDALGVKVRIEDHGGDYQEFDFEERRIRINPGLEDEIFEIG